MKKLIILLSFVAFNATAQKEISAQTIFDLIDKEKQVEYDGVTITGNLDLTELSNKKQVSKNNGYHEYKSTVKVALRFTNCRFKGDFIAYKHTQNEKKRKIGEATITWNFDEGDTYTADFNQNINIEKCVFEGKSEFKYSDFEESVSFEGTKFEKEANFKYATFKKGAIFAKTDFSKYASFKYSKFKQDTDFFDVRFDGYADFKYADFSDRVTFKSTSFGETADFKYADFDNSGNFDNTKFAKGSDFKYSNGKKYAGK